MTSSLAPPPRFLHLSARHLPACCWTTTTTSSPEFSPTENFEMCRLLARLAPCARRHASPLRHTAKTSPTAASSHGSDLLRCCILASSVADGLPDSCVLGGGRLPHCCVLGGGILLLSSLSGAVLFSWWFQREGGRMCDGACERIRQ
jgi:hypothetical protein